VRTAVEVQFGILRRIWGWVATTGMKTMRKRRKMRRRTRAAAVYAPIHLCFFFFFFGSF
jgi:hypothetical protein